MPKSGPRAGRTCSHHDGCSGGLRDARGRAYGQRMEKGHRSLKFPTTASPSAPACKGIPLLPPVGDPKATRSVVSPGTGQLISSGSRRKSRSSAERRGGCDAEPRQHIHPPESAKTILGDILGLNYSVNPNLAGKITIQTSTPVSKSDLAALFQNALRSSGAIIIRNGDMYQVETADQFSKSVPEMHRWKRGQSRRGCRDLGQSRPAQVRGRLGDEPHS